MAQWADASSTNNIEHVGLDFAIDLDSNYDPSWLEANCPMCRTRTTAAPDEELARLLQRKYPTLYAERCVEEEIERGSRMAGNGEEGIMLLIGNKHRIERDPDENENQHDWTFFVRTSRPELIKEVRVHLVHCLHSLLESSTLRIITEEDILSCAIAPNLSSSEPRSTKGPV